jgi:hypothetical protein
MGAAAKTPKSVVQLMLAVAYDKSNAAPDTIVDHEQIWLKSQFEAIASARTISALNAMWKTLSADHSPEEFERIGYGTAIRKQAHSVLFREFKRDVPHRNGAGAGAKEKLESLINNGELPPRPGQVLKPTTADDASSAKPKKRSRKKAST